MKKREMRFFLISRISILLILLVLILPAGKAALGVSPGKIEINFEPNVEKSYTIQAIGDNPEQELEVFTRGELGKYVTFDRKTLFGGGVFTATLKLPEKIDKPGVNEIMIVVREKVNESTGIGTSITIQVPIYIHVPYPGKYAEIALKANNVNVGEPVNFYLTILSRGKEDINAKPRIEIFSENESVETLYLEQTTVKSQETASLKKVLDTSSYRPGAYTALAVVDYGGAESAKTTAEFKIGSLFVKLTNYTDKITINGISKFQVEIESNWNSRIDNVYANVLIGKNATSTESLASFKTPSASLEPWGKASLEGFFDTGNFTKGIYNANITLVYSGNSSSNLVSVKFVKKESKLFLTAVLAVIIIILILAILLVKKLSIRKRKNGMEKKSAEGKEKKPKRK